MAKSYSRRHFFAAAILLISSLSAAKATDLNPAALSYKLPEQIEWKMSEQTDEVLLGDPSQEGLYIILVKWPLCASHEPSPFPSSRPLHYRDFRDLVGGHR